MGKQTEERGEAQPMEIMKNNNQALALDLWNGNKILVPARIRYSSSRTF